MTNMQDDDFDPAECIVEFDLEELAPSPPPVSPIQELMQSVAASLPPITAAAPSSASTWAEMNAAKTGVQNRIKELMQSDPILSKFINEHYGIQINAAPFIKGKEGASKVFTAIINHILTQSGAVKSQTQIRSYVAEMFPSHTVPRDWTKPLPAWAVNKIKQRIKNSAAPIFNIQLPKAVTLSLLHRTAAAAMERHKIGVQAFRPVIEVSDTSILINGVAFPVGDNKVKGGTYKYLRAPMIKLFEALDAVN